MTVGPATPAPKDPDLPASLSANPLGAPRRRSDVRLSTLILDVGGVILPTLFEITNDPTLPRGPFGPDERYRAVERGELQERDYWTRVMQVRPGLDIGKAMQSIVAVRDEIRGLLDDFHGKVRLVALTNDMAYWFGPEWRSKFADFAKFDFLLEADGVGLLKPHPEVFRWALSCIGGVGNSCLFVDDLPGNLVGARVMGMYVERFAVSDPAGSVQRIRNRFSI